MNQVFSDSLIGLVYSKAELAYQEADTPEARAEEAFNELEQQELYYKMGGDQW